MTHMYQGELPEDPTSHTVSPKRRLSKGIPRRDTHAHLNGKSKKELKDMLKGALAQLEDREAEIKALNKQWEARNDLDEADCAAYESELEKEFAVLVEEHGIDYAYARITEWYGSMTHERWKNAQPRKWASATKVIRALCRKYDRFVSDIWQEDQ